jgi:hypothetical protein
MIRHITQLTLFELIHHFDLFSPVHATIYVLFYTSHHHSVFIIVFLFGGEEDLDALADVGLGQGLAQSIITGVIFV